MSDLKGSVSSDGFRPDRPGDLPDGERALAAALAHAAAGYPVVPLRKCAKVALPGFREGIVDPVEIQRVWGRSPGSQVGVVLDGTGLVVLDVDGPEGEAFLQRMRDLANVDLPETYEVATGRGRHLYFQVPDGVEDRLVTQNGGDHGRPRLDVKLTWLLVVPGSRHHKSGRLYAGSWDHIPTAAELPVLPATWWAQIEARRKHLRKEERKGTVPSVHASGAGAKVPGDLCVGNVVDLEGGVGRRLAGLLNDTSDGRDGRVFVAVLLMRRAGVSHADIRATVLASPLGQKAWESGQPLVWLEHKIQAADQAMQQDEIGCDPATWWHAVMKAQLSETQVRVAAHLTGRVYNGMVTHSKGKISLGSAMSDASDVVDGLVGERWLRVARPHDSKTMTPARYALCIPTPNEHSGGGEAKGELAPHPVPLIYTPSRMTAYADHDAFRPRPGPGGAPTLHGGFRVLCLLDHEVPMSTADLAEHLGQDPTTTRRHLKPLQKARLVVSSRGSHWLSSEGIRPLLDEAARASRTTGMKAEHEKRLRVAAEENLRRREEMGTVGAPEWRRLNLRDLHEANDHPSRKALTDLWLADGLTLDDLTEYQLAAYERRLQRRHDQHREGQGSGQRDEPSAGPDQ